MDLNHASNNHCKTKLLSGGSLTNGSADLEEDPPRNGGGDNTSIHGGGGASLNSPSSVGRRYPHREGGAMLESSIPGNGDLRFRGGAKGAQVSMGVRIDEACRILFPLNFLCFNIFYWWYYLYY